MSAITLVNQSLFSNYHQDNALLTLPKELLRYICMIMSKGENIVESGTNLSKFSLVCKFTNGLIKSFTEGSIVSLAISNAKSTIYLQTGKNEYQAKLQKYESALEHALDREDAAFKAHNSARLAYMLKSSPENHEAFIQTGKVVSVIQLEQNLLATQIVNVKEALCWIDQEIDQIANPTLGAMEISPAQQN